MSVTLANIKSRALQLADMENSTFVDSTAELLSYINASYLELYDLIVQSYEDYYLTSTMFTLADSDNGLSVLPTDFYKIKGMDYSNSGQYVTIQPFQWNRRNRRSAVSRSGLFTDMGLSYRIVGNYIHIEPRDNAVGTYQMWYVPALTQLVLDADVVDSVMTRAGWEEYIVIDVARKMLRKEESDTNALSQMKEEMKARIVDSAADRDVGSPNRVQDVRSYRDDYNGDEWR